MITYKTIKEEFEIEDIGSYTSYGITALSGDGRVVESISDLSVERLEVERLVELCNELELDPVHLMDVAEDFLA